MAAFVWNILSVGLNYFGVNNNPISIGVIGLSESGKTSLIQLLSSQTVMFKSFVQPQHLTRLVYPAFVEIIFNNVNLRLYELGYYMYMKPGYKNSIKNKEKFFKDMDALIYMIDITDNYDKFYISKKYFMEMLTMNNKSGKKVPILVLGNKIDRFTRSPQDIWNKYQLGAIFGIYSNRIIKDIVFGYIENINIYNYNIPFDIKQLCYKYYIGYIYNTCDHKYDCPEIRSINYDDIYQDLYQDQDREREESHEESQEKEDIICKPRLCRTDSFRDIKIELLMCSVMKRIGLKESLEWLINVCRN